MKSLFRCLKCGHEVACNDKITAFEVPPSIYCYHNDEKGDADKAYEMEEIARTEIDTEQESVHKLGVSN